MARLCCCLLLLFIVSPLQADPLNSADRQLLLEKLKELKEAAEGRKGSRIGVALSAFRPAMSSADAAIDLYLKCVEKLDFEDQHRKSQDFREWKRRQKDNLKDPGMRLALQLQLQWLVYTLEVADEPQEISKLAPKAADGLNDIFSNAEKLKGHQNTLRRSVTSTVFARAYNVSDVDPGDWPTEPLSLNKIYDKVILPPLRRPDRVESLRAMWLKRIQQEALMREIWTHVPSSGRVGMKDTMKPPAFEKFLTDERPNLIWRMEQDLFKAGDQRGAALRMLDHLTRYVGHPNAPEWTDQFIGLISPKEEEGSSSADDPDPDPGPDPEPEPLDDPQANR